MTLAPATPTASHCSTTRQSRSPQPNRTRLQPRTHCAALLAGVLLVVAAAGVRAADTGLGLEVIPSKQVYGPGDTVTLAVRATIPAKHHLYGNPLGPGIGKPLRISVEGTQGVRWDHVLKEKARKFEPIEGDWVWAYEKKAHFFIRGIADSAGSIKGNVVVDALICHTACLPVNARVPFSFSVEPGQAAGAVLFDGARDLAGQMALAVDTMPLAPSPASAGPVSAGEAGLSALNLESMLKAPPAVPEWEYTPREPKIEFNFGLAILFGFLAGVILNVMPCVLPVLGIKILSFSEAQGGSRRKAVLRSVAFSGGMLSVFAVLASLASFANFSWGQQFQNPKVLVAIIGLIVVFALGMFDVFMILVPGSISGLERKSGSGMLGDFFKGMFATVLATPCSGPLLGATLAWTLTRSAATVFTVFMSIGVGMASPYILFASSKRLARIIPKPGTWMNDFKYLMGFVLMGMAVYLMIGLPKDMIVSTIGFCLFLALAVALYSRFVPFGSSHRRKAVMLLVALAVGGAGVYVNFVLLYSAVSDRAVAGAEQSSGVWREFSPELLQSAHDEGRHVMVDFTASWCMNCQYNKAVVLHSREIDELIERKNIVAIKADLTRPNPQIESLLHHLGSRSVPFLAIFPGDNPSQPLVMRDLLSKKAVRRVLGELQ